MKEHRENLLKGLDHQKGTQIMLLNWKFFQEFFISDVWKLLCEMTYLNAVTKIANNPQNNKGHCSKVSLHEMKAFFRLVIAMGIVKLPAIDLYWKKDKWVFDVPSFNKVMSRP